jgi:hypothetical protein
MKVFISFSGDRSAAVAAALRDWLPSVIQATKPFLSKMDIQKGLQWQNEIATALAGAGVGIICITPENVREPWILFESGALSKALATGRVCTYLFDMKPTDVPDPLGMFQATVANQTETRNLVHSINAVTSEPLETQRLDRIFDQWWPNLDDALQKIPRSFVNNKSIRPDRELLEEVLARVRGQTYGQHVPPFPQLIEYVFRGKYRLNFVETLDLEDGLRMAEDILAHIGRNVDNPNPHPSHVLMVSMRTDKVWGDARQALIHMGLIEPEGDERPTELGWKVFNELPEAKRKR